MTELNTRDLAWVAGFLEGEGSFTHHTSLQVAAAQVQQWPLKKLQSMFGGSIFIDKRKRKGRENAKPIGQWYLHGPRAAAVMMMMYSFMSPKRRRQIEKALRIWKTKKIAHKYKLTCPKGHAYQLSLRAGRRHRYCPLCDRTSNTNWHRRKRLEKRRAA